MDSVAGTTNGGGQDEWRTATKSKWNKPAKASSQPKQPTIPEERNEVTMTKGDQASENSSNGASTQNGETGGRGRRLGGGRGRSQHSTYYNNTQQSKPAITKEDALNKRKLLEKEVKNLGKHDIAVDRASRLFNEEIGKSHDRIRRAFEEMRFHLNEREKFMMDELDRCKLEGTQLLQEGRERARNLREESDRAASMTEKQANDLRDQIRRFLVERRFEEELGRTIRFQYEPDKLILMIKNFGEVIPARREEQKRMGQNGVVSNGDGGDAAGALSDKPVSEISVGGIFIQSDSMNAEQLAQLTRHLQESLKLQGISEDILPDVTGVADGVVQNQSASSYRRPYYNGGDRYGAGGGGDGRNRRGRRGGRGRDDYTTR